MITFIYLWCIAIVFGLSAVSEAENIVTDCTIFNRSASEWDTPQDSPLPQGFESGKIISVRASLKPKAGYFWLFILNTNHRFEFMLKVELTKDRIGFINKLGENWNDRTQSANTSFKANETFNFDLYHEKDSLLIFVNDSTIARFSMDPNTDLSKAYLHIFGDVMVDTVCYRDGKAPAPVEVKEVSGAKNIATNCIIYERSADEEDTDEFWPLPQGFQSGGMISVYASLRPGANSFLLRIVNVRNEAEFRLEVKPTKNLTTLENKFVKYRGDDRFRQYWESKRRYVAHYGQNAYYRKYWSKVPSFDNVWESETQTAKALFKANETFKLDLYHKEDGLLIFVNDFMAVRFPLKRKWDVPEASLMINSYHGIIVDKICYKDGKAPVPDKSSADEPVCDREDGQCSSGDVCLNKDTNGICESFDIAMKGGDCIDFNGSEEYANHYVRVNLTDGFMNQSKFSFDTRLYYLESRNNSIGFYSVDDQIASVSYVYNYSEGERHGLYERFSNDSNLLVPKGWNGQSVNVRSRNIMPVHLSLKNIGNTILAEIMGETEIIGETETIGAGAVTQSSAFDGEQLKKPFVVHLKNQIFPSKICYEVPQEAKPLAHANEETTVAAEESETNKFTSTKIPGEVR